MTVTFLLIRSAHAPESITTTVVVVPSVHEFIRVGGLLYRVEDVTHDLETQGIEVRCVA